MKHAVTFRNPLVILFLLVAIQGACSLPVQPIDDRRWEQTPSPALSERVTPENPVVQPTRALPLDTISPTTLQPVGVDEVLQEITFGGTGGGGACIVPLNGYQGPEFQAPPEQAELTKMLSVLSCGWSKDEPVKFTVVYPDGRQFSQMYRAVLDDFEGVYHVSVHYQVGIDDPEGAYMLIQQGAKEKIQITVQYRKPAGPHLVSIYQDPFDHRSAYTKLILVGFAANERVRIYIYQNNHGYFVAGKQEVQVGPDGRLSVNLQIKKDYSIAVGETTGEVYEQVYSPNDMLHASHSRIYCPGAKPSRVGKSQTVRAAPPDGSLVAIYQQPGFDQEVVTQVEKGTEMSTNGRNECAQGVWWWSVYSDPNGGWVPETDPVNYTIEPVP